MAVPAEHGEDEVMVVLLVKDPAAFDYAKFFAWVDLQLPKFMCPRYAEAMAELPRNATTQRIKKYELRARGISVATCDRQAAA
jgi:crotonobetaine/carnitine-CoA ligase